MWLLVQAVLQETRRHHQRPEQLEEWTGQTEVRRMEPEPLIAVAEFYRQELDDLGMWEFAARYVPITDDEWTECLGRAETPMVA